MSLCGAQSREARCIRPIEMVWSFEKLLAQPMRGPTCRKLIVSGQKRIHIVHLTVDSGPPHTHAPTKKWAGTAESLQTKSISHDEDVARYHRPTRSGDLPGKLVLRTLLVYRARSQGTVSYGSEESSTTFPRMGLFRVGCVRQHVLQRLSTDA